MKAGPEASPERDGERPGEHVSGMAGLQPRIRSIEQILSPGFVRAAQIADNLAIDVKVVGLWPLH